MTTFLIRALCALTMQLYQRFTQLVGSIHKPLKEDESTDRYIEPLDPGDIEQCIIDPVYESSSFNLKATILETKNENHGRKD